MGEVVIQQPTSRAVTSTTVLNNEVSALNQRIIELNRDVIKLNTKADTTKAGTNSSNNQVFDLNQRIIELNRDVIELNTKADITSYSDATKAFSQQIDQRFVQVGNTVTTLFAVEILILLVISILLIVILRTLNKNLNKLQTIEESQKSSARDLIASIKSLPRQKD